MQSQKGYQTVLEGGQEFIIGLVGILSAYDTVRAMLGSQDSKEPNKILDKAIEWCRAVSNGFAEADTGGSPNRASAFLRIRVRLDNIEYLLMRARDGVSLTERDESIGDYITPSSEPGHSLASCIYSVYWSMTHVTPTDVSDELLLVNSMANDLLNNSNTWIFLKSEIRPF